MKGALLGLLPVAAVTALAWTGAHPASWIHLAAWALVLPALGSFSVMNFTGATTFTSLSGVLQEMRLAIPVQMGAVGLGALLWIAGLFLTGGGPA